MSSLIKIRKLCNTGCIRSLASGKPGSISLKSISPSKRYNSTTFLVAFVYLVTILYMEKVSPSSNLHTIPNHMQIPSKLLLQVLRISRELEAYKIIPDLRLNILELTDIGILPTFLAY